jgi:predicted outer membrane protein
LIEEVVGKDSNQISSKLEGIKKALRKQSKEKDVAEIRQQIMTHRDNLQVLLQALNLYVAQKMTQ